MTPSEFVRIRRAHQRIGLFAFADQTAITPDRIKAIEAGERPTASEADLISAVLNDAFDVLSYLLEGQAIRLCKVCACHEYDACLDGDGTPCSWISQDLCSHCSSTIILAFDPAARPYVREAA